MSAEDIQEFHWTDVDGNPAGGVTSAVGMTISWQNGPLGRGEDRKTPNGAFVETVLKAALGRLLCYQDSRFACDYNAEAIGHIRRALGALRSRTVDREAREVEGLNIE